MLRTLLTTAALAAMLTPWPAFGAEVSTARRQMGDTYEITRVRDSANQSDGSSGSSHDADSIIERVVRLRADGAELEYDLPKALAAGEKAGNWQLPARVFEPDRGPLQLMNEPELQARIDPWLHAAGLSRTACGQWIFTWNAFHIECDPHTVIETIEAFRLGPATLRAGDRYLDHEALEPRQLMRAGARADRMTLKVRLDIDPEVVRRHRADTDLVIAEIRHKPTTLDVALSERAKEKISGTILVTFELDAAGTILRRTKVTELLIAGPTGKTERQTITETLEKRRVSER